MGNFILGTGILDYTPTISSPDNGYPASNVKIYNCLKAHCRSATSAATVYLVLDFGSAKVAARLLLNDVNFTSCHIEGSNDPNFGAIPFRYPAAGSLAVPKDGAVQRYKADVPLAGFNYRYLRVVIPAQAVTDGIGVFRLGTAVVVAASTELTESYVWPYRKKAEYPKPIEIPFQSGGRDLIETGDLKQWSCRFGVDYLKANEEELWTVDAIKPTDYLIFAENRGDASKAYLCRKLSAIEVEETDLGLVKVSVIEFEEVI